MKKFASFLAVATAFALVATSCKDDDDDKSRTQYLTDHSWVLSKVEMKANGVTTPIPTDSWAEECTQDNIMTFTTDFKFTDAPGADDCNGDETTETGTWAWKDGENVLSITTDGFTQELDINELNGSTLRVSLGDEAWDMNGDGIDDATVEILVSFKSK